MSSSPKSENSWCSTCERRAVEWNSLKICGMSACAQLNPIHTISCCYESHIMDRNGAINGSLNVKKSLQLANTNLKSSFDKIRESTNVGKRRVSNQDNINSGDGLQNLRSKLAILTWYWLGILHAEGLGTVEVAYHFDLFLLKVKAPSAIQEDTTFINLKKVVRFRVGLLRLPPRDRRKESALHQRLAV